ncbi:MAG: CbiX/SirB N-terminal domain-containing protein [Prochlorococcaceae cyanobacterium]
MTVSPPLLPLASPASGPECVPSWCPMLSCRPADLPPLGDPERWSWLRRLRRHTSLPLEPWLQAIEIGRVEVDPDLLAALADHIDAPASFRLLRWWLDQPQADPALLASLARPRHPASGDLLRRALAVAGPERAAALLPLLGHQRQPQDFSTLEAWVRAPHPAVVRRAALEGLALGLPAWPLPPLRALLLRLAVDLEEGLAATAVDLLARLPQARRSLARLQPRQLGPAVLRRRQRRLASLPAAPLVLVVHGRGGGLIPSELEAFAAELELRRGAPVRLQGLTAAEPPDPAPLRQAAAGGPITLLPLLLLPGSHVRHDLPALTAAWCRSGPVRRLPFLGAWPAWQAALREEAVALRAGAAAPPLLLHHPLSAPVAHRYLAHLARVCGTPCRAAAYSAGEQEELLPLLEARDPMPVLPLVLAANRLTEALPAACGVPLLLRPRFRACLLELLEALP